MRSASSAMNVPTQRTPTAMQRRKLNLKAKLESET
jgi:hypothetical protein